MSYLWQNKSHCQEMPRQGQRRAAGQQTGSVSPGQSQHSICSISESYIPRGRNGRQGFPRTPTTQTARRHLRQAACDSSGATKKLRKASRFAAFTQDDMTDTKTSATAEPAANNSATADPAADASATVDLAVQFAKRGSHLGVVLEAGRGLVDATWCTKHLTSDEQASDIAVGVLLSETLRLFDSASFREVVPHLRSDADVEESLSYWHCREVRLAATELCSIQLPESRQRYS